MLDIGPTKPTTSPWTEIRAAIGAILANKYKGSPSTPPPRFLKELVNLATSPPSDVDNKTFEANTQIAMNILAGAAARQDKSVLEVIPLLHAAISSSSPAGNSNANGEFAAQSLGIIVQDNEFLTTANHAIVKRFYKQWAYNYMAKPLYDLAHPAKSDPAIAARYTTAIVAIVRNCPFTVYQDDLEPLVRLLIISLVTEPADNGGGSVGLSNQEIARRRTVSAIEILIEILSNEPDSLRDHLKPIITGGTKLYQEIRQRQEGSDLHLVMGRKLVLQLLGAIPTKFEERHLLPYAPQLKRVLAMACGDTVREIRKTAILARENWNKISG